MYELVCDMNNRQMEIDMKIKNLEDEVSSLQETLENLPHKLAEALSLMRPPLNRDPGGGPNRFDQGRTSSTAYDSSEDASPNQHYLQLPPVTSHSGATQS